MSDDWKTFERDLQKPEADRLADNLRGYGVLAVMVAALGWLAWRWFT